jgi:predicted SAM-dependent methyltransferase
LTASGILRVVAPDLGLLCQQYMKSALESPSDDEFNADRFLRDTCLVADDAAERTWVRALRRLLGRDRHYWMYDEGSLLARFREAGFTSVVRRSFRESLIPDINLLDIPARASESLYVEGQKLLGR